jgi:hypothetical protein
LRSGDPRKASKPLVGPLAGYYRITYARYRAVYSVQEELLVGGERILHLRVIFIAAGVRKERDKRDIYRIAEKLVRLLPGSQPGQAKELPPEQA